MSAIKNKIDLYVAKEAIRMTNIYLAYGRCEEHLWRRHGHGYSCEHCGRYTGLDRDLNKLIKKFLEVKK